MYGYLVADCEQLCPLAMFVSHTVRTWRARVGSARISCELLNPLSPIYKGFPPCVNFPWVDRTAINPGMVFVNQISSQPCACSASMLLANGADGGLQRSLRRLLVGSKPLMKDARRGSIR